MANELTIPALPCRSIDDVEAFYTALGFTRTYRQVRPNPYLAVRWEDIELHFFGMPEFDPEDSYGTCLSLSPTPGTCSRPSPRAYGRSTASSWWPGSPG